eukprot:2116943-Rhodomonas_salina.1
MGGHNSHMGDRADVSRMKQTGGTSIQQDPLSGPEIAHRIWSTMWGSHLHHHIQGDGDAIDVALGQHASSDQITRHCGDAANAMPMRIMKLL